MTFSRLNFNLTFSMTGYAIALPKGSKYKDMLDRKIIEYIYSGFIERSQKFWFTGSCNKQKEEKKTDGLGFLQISSGINFEFGNIQDTFRTI